MSALGSGGPARTIRRASILMDVQDLATARLAAVNGAASKAATSLQGAEGAARGVSAAFKAVGIAAIGGVLAIRRLVQIGSGLQRTFSTIQETMSATTAEMEMVRNAAAEIGRTMPLSMTEATNAMKQFSFAGFEAAEASRAANATAQLAVAGQMDMADATKATTQMMNAFGIEADSVAQSVASLTATFATSAINIPNLSSAMSYASAVMSGLGFSITEVNSAMGTMADAGLEGTMAGTALNQAFNKMIGQTGKVDQALEAVGVQMSDLTDEQGNMLPMVEIVRELSGALEEAGISGRGLNRWMVDMFGQRGARAMLPLFQNLDEFEDKIQTSALAQLKAFNEEMDSLEDRDLAESTILFNTESNIEERRQELAEMSDEEVIQLASDMELPDEPIDQMAAIRERFQEGALEMQDMVSLYEHVFNLENEAARQLAQMTADEETSIDQLKESLDDAVTSGELTEAQMDTVAGRLRFLRGSFESAAFQIYKGFAPALEVILDLFIAMTNNIIENTWLLRGLGAALFAVTAAATTYTAVTAASMAQTALFGGSIAKVTGWAARLIQRIGNLHLAIKTFSRMMYGSTSAVNQLRTAVVMVWRGMSRWLKILALITVAVAIIESDLLGLGSAFDWVVGALADLGGAIADLLTWLNELPWWVKAAAAALLFLVNPAVGAFVAVEALISKFGGLKEATEALFGPISFLAGPLSRVGDLIYWIGGGLANMGRGVAGWLDELFELIEAWDGSFEARDAIIAHISDGIEAAANYAGNNAVKILESLFGGLIGAIPGMGGGGGEGNVGSAMLDLLMGGLDWLGRNYMKIVEPLSQMIILVVVLALVAVLGTVGILGMVIIKIAEAIVELFIDAFKGLKGWWADEVVSVWSDVLSDVNDRLPDAQHWQDKTKSWVDNALSGLDNFGRNVRQKTQNWASSFNPIEWLVDLIGDGLAWAFEQVMPLIEPLISLLDDLFSIVGDVLNSMRALGRFFPFTGSLDIDVPEKEDFPEWFQVGIERWMAAREGAQSAGEDPAGAARGILGGIVEGIIGGHPFLEMPDEGGGGSGGGDEGEGEGQPSTKSTGTTQPTTDPLGQTQTGSKIEYANRKNDRSSNIDARKVVIEQSPNITVEGSRMSGDDRAIQRQIEEAMEYTKQSTLEDMYDWLVLGGPQEVSEQVGQGSQPGTPPTGGEGEQGDGTTPPGEGGGEGGDGTGEGGDGTGEGGDGTGDTGGTGDGTSNGDTTL